MTPQQRKEYAEEEARQIEACKASLAQTYGLERNKRFDIAWRIAWDYGHSAGLSEVEIYFTDLVDLLKP